MEFVIAISIHVTFRCFRQNLKSKAPVIVWSDGEDDASDADGDVSARSGGSGSESSRRR